LTAADIRSLVTSTTQEAFDLDFKLTLYGRGDSDKRALAGDVAALANTAGGVIVLGVGEDDHARATSTPGVELSDTEVARIRQVVASLVAPMPVFDVLTLPDASQSQATSGIGDSPGPAHGFVLIAVPRSPQAPHAVLVNDALRYPRRNGATTRYLSEPEVATAYRDRVARAGQLSERVKEVERDAVARLDTTDGPWVVVSLVPDLAGDLVINRDAYLAFQRQVVNKRPTVVDTGLSTTRARVASRRLLADGTTDNSPHARWVLLELHADGSGVCGLRVGDLAERHRSQQPPTDGEPRQQLIDDESIAVAILSGLLNLAQHARDRAAAGGNALVRAQVVPVSEDRPTHVGHTRGFGLAESRSTFVLTTAPPPAEAAAPLDDLVESGPALVATAALLLDQVGHAFGVAEMGQLSHDGQMRQPYWGTTWRTQISAWAEQHGIEVTDEKLP